MSANHAPIFTCGEIVEATKGVLLSGALDRQFVGVSTDSRQTVKGNLFIALKGDTFDGHHFLDVAVLGGAAGLVVEEAGQNRIGREFLGNTAVIGVEDTLDALGAIARFWRKRFAIPVIGITGSAGKTSTKEMTAAILSRVKNVHKTEGNFNNLVGLPLTILGLHGGHEVAVLEMGTNCPGEIGRLARMAEPTVGVITNIGPAHLEGLKSIDCVRIEKGDLFRHLAADGAAVINLDDPQTRQLGEAWPGRKTTFGIRSAADVTAAHIEKMGIDGVRFELVIGGAGQTVQLRQAGEHHIYNALAAAAAATALGVEPSEIAQGLSSFRTTAGRTQIVPLRNGSFILNDAYNANPLSMREAVKTLDDLKGGGTGVMVIGDMLELGDQAAALHEEIGAFIAEHPPAFLFLKGTYAPFTAKGAGGKGFPKERMVFFEDAGDIAARLKALAAPGVWILVKGSRRMKLDELIRQISDEIGVENENVEDQT